MRTVSDKRRCEQAGLAIASPPHTYSIKSAHPALDNLAWRCEQAGLTIASHPHTYQKRPPRP
eukprot:351312-Chlamydomonas_euryale.AAC.2